MLLLLSHCLIALHFPHKFFNYTSAPTIQSLSCDVQVEFFLLHINCTIKTAQAPLVTSESWNKFQLCFPLWLDFLGFIF